MDDQDRLLEVAREFAELGAELRGDGDSDTALRRMLDLAVKQVPGCSWASVTALRGNKGRTIAQSDPVAAAADQLQFRLGEGPCLQAAEENTEYLLFDVERERRWPRYCTALREQTPIRSVLAFELPAEDRAALNLFADQPAAFTDESVSLGAVFAAHVSTAVALYESEQETTNLKAALASNRQIGAAIGILMAYHRVSEQAAFDLLRTVSQNLHVKLRDVAEEVLETGALPNTPLPSRPHAASQASIPRINLITAAND